MISTDANVYDYDNLKHSKNSKSVKNYTLVKQNNSSNPANTLKNQVNNLKLLNISALGCNENIKNKVGLKKISNSIHKLKKLPYSKKNPSRITFSTINNRLRSNYLKKRKKIKPTFNKSTQTKFKEKFISVEPTLTTTVHDQGTILKIRDKTQNKKVYVNVNNGFSSFRQSDFVEDKNVIFDFNSNFTSVQPLDGKIFKFKNQSEWKVFKTDEINIVIDEKLFMCNRDEIINNHLKYCKNGFNVADNLSNVSSDMKFFNEIKIDKRIFHDLKVLFHLH